MSLLCPPLEVYAACGRSPTDSLAEIEKKPNRMGKDERIFPGRACVPSAECLGG